MTGAPGPVTYHRLFLQAELAFPKQAGRVLRNIRIPMGINYTFREERTGMSIGNQYWYTRPVTDLLETKMYRIEQSIQFAGVHTGVQRNIRLGKKVELTTGLLLQGEIAIRHRFHQWTDSSAYSRSAQNYVYQKTEALATLKGRNFPQWSVLLPLAVEINLYKKQWLVKPEITIGILGNRYLSPGFLSRESINAAMWLVYRRH